MIYSIFLWIPPHYARG